MASGIGTNLLHELFGLFQGVPVTAQSSYALELASDAADATGTATWLTTGTAPGYSFQEIDCVPGSWQFINPRTITNKNLILYSPATTGSWASVQSAALRRLAGGVPGPVDFFGSVRQGRIIDAGERFKILPGGLVIRISPNKLNIADAFAQMILGLLQGTNINAPASITVDFGTADPTLTGDIGKLTGNGYQPLTIPCDDTNMEAPLSRRIRNAVEFDHTQLWTAGADISNIQSAAISVAGTEWIRGKFTKSKSLKTGDNLRIPAASLSVFG